MVKGEYQACLAQDVNQLGQLIPVEVLVVHKLKKVPWAMAPLPHCLCTGVCDINYMYQS